MTLLELLVVLIIVGIVATLAIGTHEGVVLFSTKAKARHALSLIAEAERIVHDETGNYVFVLGEDFGSLTTSSGVDLRSLSSPNDKDWKYAVNSYNATSFFAIATKRNEPNINAQIRLNFDGNDFVESGF